MQISNGIPSFTSHLSWCIISFKEKLRGKYHMGWGRKEVGSLSQSSPLQVWKCSTHIRSELDFFVCARKTYMWPERFHVPGHAYILLKYWRTWIVIFFEFFLFPLFKSLRQHSSMQFYLMFWFRLLPHHHGLILSSLLSSHKLDHSFLTVLKELWHSFHVQ